MRGITKRSDLWEISKLKGSHTYWSPLVLYYHRHIDSNLIVKVMLTIMKGKLSMSVVATIQGIIKRDYRHEVFYWKAWMVKQKNIDVIWYTRRVISKPT